jgi:hypothetical protein
MSPVEAAAPAIAQQNEAAARDKKVGELRQAGKSSKAQPLAQRTLAIEEKAHGFLTRMPSQRRSASAATNAQRRPRRH